MLPGAMLPHYIGFFLCNVVSGVLRQHCTGIFPVQCCLEPLVQHYLCNVVPWLTDSLYEENNLYNVISTMLGQHYTKKILVQCWSRFHRHVFAGKLPIAIMSTANLPIAIANL